MGLFDELSKALSPHAQKLNDSLNLHGAVLHQRMKEIESRLSDLARPDTGDTWRDIEFNQKLATLAPIELETVAMNEIWAVQAISVVPVGAGVTRIIIRANGKLRVVTPIAATLPPTNTLGGNVVFLPGEKVTLEFEGEGQAEVSLTVIRRRIPASRIPVQIGRSQGEETAPRNTHDPARDVIRQRLGSTYQEIQGEIRDTGGSPALIDPTSV